MVPQTRMNVGSCAASGGDSGEDQYVWHHKNGCVRACVCAVLGARPSLGPEP
jgi:hypothetical protein